MGCSTGIDIIELRLPCLRLSGHSSILSGYFHFRNNHFFVWLTFLTNMVADNLLNREFEQHGPCKVLLTDITYIPYHGVSWMRKHWFTATRTATILVCVSSRSSMSRMCKCWDNTPRKMGKKENTATAAFSKKIWNFPFIKCILTTMPYQSVISLEIRRTGRVQSRRKISRARGFKRE